MEASIGTDTLWSIPCDKCGNPTNHQNPLRCPGCKASYYCGFVCQFSHYFEHRSTCISLRNDSRRSNTNCDAEKEDKSAQLSNRKSYRLLVTDAKGSCVICFEDMHFKNRFQIPLCKHEFCYDCLRMYQFNTVDASCPICRGDLPDDIAVGFVSATSLFCHEAKSYPEQSNESLALLRIANDRMDFILRREPCHGNARMWRNIQADILARMGRYKEAIAIVSVHFKVRESTSDFQLYELGIMVRSMIKAGDVKGAAALLLPCLRNERLLQTAKALYNMKEFCSMLADLTKALYKQASIERNRRHFNAANRMLSKSISAGTSAIEMDRHCSNVYEYLALAHEKLGNMNLAMIALKKAIVYEEPWNPDKVAENKKRLEELTVRAVAAAKQAGRVRAERNNLLLAEAARRNVEAAHRKAESERKRREFEKAKEAWRREKKQALAKAEIEDMKAGRIRLADLDDDDFYFGTRKKRKGRKGRKNRCVINEEQLLCDSLDGLAIDAHNERQVQTDGEENERSETSHGCYRT